MDSLPVLWPSVLAVEILAEIGSVVRRKSQRNGDRMGRMAEEGGGK